MISNILFAQKGKTTNTLTDDWSVNLNAGSTQYWGRISNKDFSSTFKHEPTWGYGLVLSRQFSPVFAISGQYLMGKLKGSINNINEGQPAHLLYASDLIEFNLSAKVNFTNMLKGYKPNRLVNIYGLAGIGLSSFQGTTTNLTDGTIVHYYGYSKGSGINGYELEGLGTVGIGLSIKLSNKMDFTFENALKLINTNKLNGKKSGLNFDSYGYSSIGLTYNFKLYKEKKAEPVVIKGPNPALQKPVASQNKPVVKVKSEYAPVPAQVEKVKQQKVKKEEQNPAEEDILFSGYKVQFLATQSPASIDSIKQHLKLSDSAQIREDHYDKWYRYSVGEYQTYKDADAYREFIYARYQLKDSFVVKFEYGKRVGQVSK